MAGSSRSHRVSSLGTVSEAVTFRLYFVNNEGGGTWADLTTGSGGLIVNGTASAREEDITWTADDSDTWEVNGADDNWDSSDGTFQQGDSVTFDDSVNALFSGTVTVSGAPLPGAITVNNTLQDYVLAGEFAGSGTLTKNGPGLLTINASDSNSPFTGPIALNAGTLVLDGFTTALQNAGTMTIASGATFRVDAGNGGQDSLPPIVLSGGTLQIDDVDVFIFPASATVELAGGTDSTLTGLGNFRMFSASITGAGNLIKDGSGSLLATGLGMEHTGTTTINDGLVLLGANRTAASPQWTINGGELRLNDDSAAPIQNLAATPDIALNGGEFQVAGNTETLGTLSIDSSSATTTLTIDANGADLTVSTLDLTGTDNRVAFLTPITASGTYEVLTATTVSGTLGTNLTIANLSPSAQVWSHDAGGTGLVTVTIDLTGGDALSYTNASTTAEWGLGGPDDFSDGGSPVVFLNADNVTFGDAPFAGPGTLDLTLTTEVLPGSVSFTNTTGNNYSLSGSPIAGVGGLSIDGSGTVTLGSENTYTGGTTVNSGCLVVGTAAALPASGSATTVNTGGELAVLASGLTDGEIVTLANNATWSGGSLVFFVESGDTQSFAGDLTGGAFATSGASILVKGGGTLDFTGATLPVTPTSNDGSTILGIGPAPATVITDVALALSPGSVSGVKATLTFTADGAVDIYASSDLISWGTPVAEGVTDASPVEIDNLADAKQFFVVVSAGEAFPAP